MDINLPVISGIQVLKTLREDPLTAHIPVIAISANAMPHDIEKGLEVGFFRYLTKPIKINELMETLDIALDLAETKSDGAINLV
jgi:CheY-like chemotaxis protein